MGSGCGDPIVEKFLRPPGNSPSRWHLTRDLLLCSAITIHDSAPKVKTDFPYFLSFSLIYEKHPASPSLRPRMAQNLSLIFRNTGPNSLVFPQSGGLQ